MTMTPRSLQVRPDAIERVKKAYQRSGYSTQQSLAEAVELHLDTVSRFLNGKPVDRLNFFDLCETLSLNSGEIAWLEPGNVEAPGKREAEAEVIDAACEEVPPGEPAEAAAAPGKEPQTESGNQVQITQNVIANQGKVIGNLTVNGNVTL